MDNYIKKYIESNLLVKLNIYYIRYSKIQNTVEFVLFHWNNTIK